ncbi:glycosyltransferase family 2 protein [Yeosuana sp.]|uniref:glycosyltransferase family 2 protein n=1 Tax=Yeosuana sp. TaxID=2529388 RepID=UPI004054EA6B|tara:strand:- start:495 stop:1622 length:1128 start_codon:yes stop_codon:yes gene_type:complete
MILVYIIITIVYLLLISGFIYGFDKIKEFKLANLQSKTKFSVIIPFRNEAKHLPLLLSSITSIAYPKHLFEIIFVDDASEDDSVDLIHTFKNENASFNISLLNNNRQSHSPKKDAITTAISHSKYDWIITTDADCVLPKYWLDSYDAYIQHTNAMCIAAPVTFFNESNFLSRFQLLDILSLQGATIGGFGVKRPFLCNGANFAYKRAVFIEVNGFEGNTTIASGDDIFLLEKIARLYPKQVAFLKCDQAIVKTNAQPSWKKLINQRIRWASKISSYENWFGKLTGLIILLMNALIMIGVFLTGFSVIKIKIFLYILFIKFNIDVLLIYKAATFFNQKPGLRSVVFGFIIYPFFSVYIAFISVFKSYSWKGRVFKK